MAILETVARLAETMPLDKDTVEAALDIALRGDADNANRYVFVLKSFRVPEGIGSVELRVPLEGATRRDGFLIVELDAKGDPVSPDEVRARFGEAFTLSSPNPSQPDDAPEYFSYAKPWGSIAFGFARPKKDRLTTVVIDRER